MRILIFPFILACAIGSVRYSFGQNSDSFKINKAYFNHQPEWIDADCYVDSILNNSCVTGNIEIEWILLMFKNDSIRLNKLKTRSLSLYTSVTKPDKNKNYPVYSDWMYNRLIPNFLDVNDSRKNIMKVIEYYGITNIDEPIFYRDNKALITCRSSDGRYGSQATYMIIITKEKIFLNTMSYMID